MRPRASALRPAPTELFIRCDVRVNRLYSIADIKHNIWGMALPDWVQRGACRGLGCEEFVKDQATDCYSSSARKVCARCPVRPQCLKFALADPSIYGLWGGTDERERKEIRKRRSTSKEKIDQ